MLLLLKGPVIAFLPPLPSVSFRLCVPAGLLLRRTRAGQEAVGGNEKAGGGRLNFESPLPPESGSKCPLYPTNGRRKKLIFGVFEGFFWTYKCRKNAAQIFVICVTFCVTFCVKILRKWCRKNAASCGAAKTPQNLTKCRVCGVFAARISGKKLKNHKIRLLCRWIYGSICFQLKAEPGSTESSSSTRKVNFQF